MYLLSKESFICPQHYSKQSTCVYKVRFVVEEVTLCENINYVTRLLSVPRLCSSWNKLTEVEMVSTFMNIRHQRVSDGLNARTKSGYKFSLLSL